MYSIWNAPSDCDYYDPQGLFEARETEEDDRCFDCGARDDQACVESCATQRLATSDDLDEQDPYASDPDDFEELNRNEADDYRNEGGIGEMDEPDGLHCAGLELAEEWA